MTGMNRSLGLALGAVLALGACDNGPSAVARNDRETPQSFADTGAAAAPPAREDRGDRASAAAAGIDHRGEPALKIDGKALWAATRRYSAEAGAERGFERNGADFGAADVEAYVRKAHAFVSRPPAGAETLARPNGDTLYYDAKANTFAVADKAGLLKTMFKPDDGAAYWREQKDRAAGRQAARRGGAGRDEG